MPRRFVNSPEVWGYSIITGASSNIDPARVATVERGTMVRSVVATGKIEPITKVEIKSKANGIIEKLLVDVDHLVVPGQVLAELDKENLNARLREARANLQAAEAAHAAAVAQLSKNEIEAENRQRAARGQPRPRLRGSSDADLTDWRREGERHHVRGRGLHRDAAS